MLQDIRILIETESPSADLNAVAHSADKVLSLGERVLGVKGERIVIDGCTHLRWRLGEGERRVLILGHHDTVWPHGTLARHPYAQEGGVLLGPGNFDMKVGVVMSFYAVASLDPGSSVTILVTGDEEIGSHTSRELIESAAAECAAVFVLEASADGGALKVARKGMSDYRVSVSGRAAHAGLEPEKGINAAVEMSHQVLRIAALASEVTGTSVVPTVLSAGTTTNTVPATADITVDVRAWTQEEQDRVDIEMRSLTPVLPGAILSVAGGLNRPPMEATMSSSLFESARAIAQNLGFGELGGAKVGGGSDGNFTAGLGIPTLDGLGAVGGGAHADDEHSVVDEIPRRTALVAGLIEHTLLPVKDANVEPKTRVIGR
ncbi:glutamate carboxypeptidase (plasmid) [Arthrobacter sp. ERGS1:01]|uniref:M20 family metallopeptidase n=1 Tax=Arthrobacter sp. ERGS1:01 TaxID=1704044 RepID=UPI0006B48904|nr:M20 family metallopeptidase [Arthrobacter sp. ERGS1:01]ALE04662.1 glutamate carboxypeptidase [Arthrobacter sp. ERGS1:01]